MKKIVYIVSTLKRTGPTSQLFNLIKYLDRSQFEPHLITLSPEPADSRWSDYEALGVQLHSLNLSRLFGVFLGKKQLGKLIGKIKPDLIHTQGIRGDVLSSGILGNIPKICTIRNIPQKDYPMTYGKFVAGLMLWRHKRAMRKLTLCVGVSRAVSDNLQQCFGFYNISTVQNGVDTELYNLAGNIEKEVLRKNIGLPQEGSLWISSGHLSARKDPLFLIDAWKRPGYVDQSNHLIFIGSGLLDQECRAAADGCANIHVLGRVTNVADYLKACDYFVSASQAEGLPNAVLEAMACGLPVLLSDIEPHKEIVAMSEKSGLLFRLGDEISFHEEFEKLCDDDREARSSAALSLVNDSLSASIMSENYQKLYNELIEGSTN
ncbi:MAG: glycosyltransferase [Marinospirillum sp.]|uniref:glycosyltransferase n=1 Tax=Marinospirillum sp. TaxID=2183934 RepID=UPI0019DE42D1|nr:glycosyltransferase [Marinospirillum sp.]MBE0508707.1 glycosyltransferase [Marinospirillum sp.]